MNSKDNGATVFTFTANSGVEYRIVRTYVRGKIGGSFEAFSIDGEPLGFVGENLFELRSRVQSSI